MHELTTESGARIQLIEEHDLETWLNAQLGKLLRWGIGLFAATIMTVVAAWFSSQSRMDALERDVSSIRTEGTPATRALSAKVDTLGLRMTYELPRLVADQVEQRILKGQH